MISLERIQLSATPEGSLRLWPPYMGISLVYISGLETVGGLVA